MAPANGEGAPGRGPRMPEPGVCGRQGTGQAWTMPVHGVVLGAGRVAGHGGGARVTWSAVSMLPSFWSERRLSSRSRNARQARKEGSMLELYFVYMRVRVCNSLLYKLIHLYNEMPAGWG